ncbi:hypothetical protein ANTQUA_LOCUS2883 [Anthophora quadrimaculata]
MLMRRCRRYTCAAADPKYYSTSDCPTSRLLLKRKLPADAVVVCSLAVEKKNQSQRGNMEHMSNEQQYRNRIARAITENWIT